MLGQRVREGDIESLVEGGERVTLEVVNEFDDRVILAGVREAKLSVTAVNAQQLAVASLPAAQE